MAMLGRRRAARPASGTSGLHQRDKAPVREFADGDSVVIERLAHDGRGVAHRTDGKALFIERALPGERVLPAVHRQRKRYDEAHVRELIETSDQRVEPACRHFGQCGGCDLQHFADAGQRQHKLAVLGEHLAREALTLPAAPEVLAADGHGYRRRARLGVKVDAQGGIHLGFRAKGSHHLLDIHQCTILVPRLTALLAPMHHQLAALEAPRHVGHIELIDSDAGATLVVRQLREHAGDRVRWQTFAAAQGVSLAWWLGRDAAQLEWLSAEPELRYRIVADGRDVTLTFAPGDFVQVNATVNQRLIDTALTWLAPDPAARVLDLYAGVGNLSLALACRGGEVLGVEGSPAMVGRLAANARRNDLGNVEARQADLTQVAEVCEVLDWAPSLVVLDPPRDGADIVCTQLAGSAVPQLLYIACDPATLARDAARLVQGGYRITRAAVADMFAQTAHLEAMLLFERGG
ncbi:23S rRNA m(5)U-1939 methyltransferase [Franzmannia pantelleriensis]|uniref:23S rRNA m(5)U-1939 methyltransferase n=1 Tax=Franzmannia pantelleriensis TaxID=48727 RepID=A0A1G9UDG1_9GAMM|nr:methyltransferase domain-containing protein [Halomonas pantelleriensis]SDM57966.1 23S rRNA m(5)U-1939 methyltransferase [Halomonas pantelleriensis]